MNNPLYIPFQSNGKWGYANESRNVLVDCLYDLTLPFNKNWGIFYQNKKYGAIHSSNLIIPPNFDSIYILDHSYLIVKKNGKYGLIDENAEEILSCTFNEISLQGFQNGKIQVNDGQNKLVSFEGTISFSTNDEIRQWTNEIVIVKNKEKFAIVNFKNEYLTDFSYDLMSIFDNNLILANVKNQYFLLNSEGNRISETYTFIKPFSNGLALVERDYKWGFINEQGNEVIPCEFFPNTKIIENERSSEPEFIEYPYFFSEEKCKVIGPNNLWGFIDLLGKVVIPFEYEDAKDFVNGFAGVKKNGKWTFINSQNQHLTSFIFDQVQSFSDGLALVKKDDL